MSLVLYANTSPVDENAEEKIEADLKNLGQ